MLGHDRTLSERRDHGGAEALALLPAAPHICGACSKRYVVVSGGAGDAAPRCSCGSALLPAALAPGVYEVKAAKRKKGAGVKAPRAVHRPEGSVPVEADLGYNESHGYGPSHGGPTGPGDAPADAPDLPPPTPPKDSDEEA